MNNKILVTGGTGFIGSHLVEALVKEGKQVRCLARNTSDIRFLKSLDVEIYYGDILDKESLFKASKNIAIIYHLAAKVRPDKVLTTLKDFRESFHNVNVKGTMNLVEAALSEGVSKFINYSSIAAVGPGENITENTLCNPITEYGKSKLEAERYIQMAHKNQGLPSIIIRPGQIYGPRCLGMLTLYRLIKYGLFYTIGNGSVKMPLCYVTDLINGTLLAEKHGIEGETYFLSGDPCTFREFSEAISRSVNGFFAKIYMPQQIMDIIIFLKELCENLVHLKLCPFKVDLSSAGIKSMTSHCAGSIDKAKNRLGYMPLVNLKEGIAHTTNWYLEKGLI